MSVRMLKFLMLSIILVAGAGLVIAGIIMLGNLALHQLHDRGAASVPFAKIECQPPPGMERVDFLDEVQYLSNWPDQVDIREDDLPRRLAAAFAKHPWVETVERVRVVPAGRIEVRLRFRRPVLAVGWKDSLRAVDAKGILLPLTASTSGLPVFQGTPLPPKGPAGTVWSDRKVVAAAKKAAEQSD